MHLSIVEIYFSLLIYWSGCKLSDDQNICDIKLSCSGVEYIIHIAWNWNCISCTIHPDSLIKTELAIFHSNQFSKNVFWAKLKQKLWMLPSQPSSSKGYYECCSKSSEIQRMDRWWRFSKNTSATCALHCTVCSSWTMNMTNGGVRWYRRWMTLVGQVVGRQDWPCKVHIFCDYLWSLPLISSWRELQNIESLPFHLKIYYF